MKAIKGFDKNLQCRGFQYEVGKTYTEKGGIKACSKGFHAIGEDASPLIVFNYYPPTIDGKWSRYCEVDVDGEIQKHEDKICCSKLTIGAEIGIPGLVKAHAEWVMKHITNENNAEPGKAATAGDSGAATAGYRGAATAGDSGAATAGDRGAATSRGSASVGENGVAVARSENAKVRGGLGALLVVAVENNDDYDIKEWKAVVVDGETVKADTWYTVRGGKLVEVDE